MSNPVKLPLTVTISSEHELDAVISDLKNFFVPGKTIALKGNLGAGKTTFVRHLIQSLGADVKVNSPTFTLVHQYEISTNFQLVHADLYRLKTKEEVAQIGINEFFHQPETLILIEWPELIWEQLPENTVVIEFEMLQGDQRSISISQKNK